MMTGWGEWPPAPRTGETMMTKMQAARLDAYSRRNRWVAVADFLAALAGCFR